MCFLFRVSPLRHRATSCSNGQLQLEGDVEVGFDSHGSVNACVVARVEQIDDVRSFRRRPCSVARVNRLAVGIVPYETAEIWQLEVRLVWIWGVGWGRHERLKPSNAQAYVVVNDASEPSVTPWRAELTVQPSVRCRRFVVFAKRRRLSRATGLCCCCCCCCCLFVVVGVERDSRH